MESIQRCLRSQRLFARNSPQNRGAVAKAIDQPERWLCRINDLTASSILVQIYFRHHTIYTGEGCTTELQVPYSIVQIMSSLKPIILWGHYGGPNPL